MVGSVGIKILSKARFMVCNPRITSRFSFLPLEDRFFPSSPWPSTVVVFVEAVCAHGSNDAHAPAFLVAAVLLLRGNTQTLILSAALVRSVLMLKRPLENHHGCLVGRS